MFMNARIHEQFMNAFTFTTSGRAAPFMTTPDVH